MPWIVITGSAKGLGAAIAFALAKQGHDLLLHYSQSKREVHELADLCRKEGVQVVCIQGDFGREEGVSEFIEKIIHEYPDIYGVVNNIGNYLIKPLSLTEREEWDALFQTNFYAAIQLIKGFSDSLKRNRGRVVTIGTVGLSLARGYKKAAAYSVVKSALYQAVLSYAKEWVIDGVTVNVVSPGYMENAVDLSDALLPMGRAATLEEVARLVAFLCAKENGYITGQNIEIAGGFGL